MRAREVMTSPVLTVPPEASQEAVAALLVSHGIASAPVRDAAGRLLGIVTESGVLAGGEADTASDLMVAAGPTAAPDDVLRHVAAGELRDDLRGGTSAGTSDGTSDEADVLDEATGPAVGPVVVGVDGTDSSLAALRWAIDQARWTSGPLGIPTASVRAVLAHAHPDLYGSQADVRRRAEAVLDVAVEAATAGPPVEVVRVVGEGHPTAVLAEQARHASMLVLGTRSPGLTGPGPIAERLIGNVGCPVVVIPGELAAPRAAAGS